MHKNHRRPLAVGAPLARAPSGHGARPDTDAVPDASRVSPAYVPPAMTILKEEETKDMMAKFYVTELQQLPTMSRYDPMSLLLGLRPGQVCKVERESVAALSLDFYRVCM